MQGGWLRVMVRYPLVVLAEQGRLTQEEAAREMGLSTRQVRQVLRVGGYYLLYVWGPRKLLGHSDGLAPDEVKTLLAGDFECCWIRGGEEVGKPSSWYLFERRRSPGVAS